MESGNKGRYGDVAFESQGRPQKLDCAAICDFHARDLSPVGAKLALTGGRL